MRESQFSSRKFIQFISRFSGNKNKSVVNSQDIDELVDRINALSNLKIIAGSKNQLHLGSQGAILELSLPQVAAAVASKTAEPFAITTLGHSDYYIARKLSNLRLVSTVPTFDVGSTDFKIAKPTFVRRSITSEHLFGTTITYRTAGVGDEDNNRIANDGTTDEAQVVLGPYITLSTLGLSTTVPAKSQCVVYAENLPGAAGVFDELGVEVTYLERTNGARVFAKKFSS